MEPAVAPPAQPTAGPSREPANSDSARTEPAPAPTVPAKRRLEADRPKGLKKPKKAVKSREMIEDSDADEEPLSTAATRRPKPRPTKQQPAKARAKKAVPGQGAGAGEAGPSNDKGKGKQVDRSSEPKPVSISPCQPISADNAEAVCLRPLQEPGHRVRVLEGGGVRAMPGLPPQQGYLHPQCEVPDDGQANEGSGG